jgi:tagaturonate reductase
LILENGKKLESIVLELAHLNLLEGDFIDWIEKSNYFCNSIVDRIVTGTPDKEIKDRIENELGYTDELLIVSEVYALWAIEGGEKIKDILSFAENNEGMVIEPNIELHRELKLRLLNGTHTLTCGLAFLSNFDTVQHAMEDEDMGHFIAGLMKNEIAPSIPCEIEEATKQIFISKVLDRFSNPHIKHYWKSITFNYSSKMRLRCVPLLINYYKNNEKAPQLFALGFAAYVYFMKAVKQQGKDFYGEFNGEPYLIEDGMAEEFYHLWNKKPVDAVVKQVLKNESLWGYDLTELPGFHHTVLKYLNKIRKDEVKGTLKNKHFINSLI